MAHADILYSLIIPAYNEEKLLGFCLDSLKTATAEIASQTEIIVVDNASTDNTAEIARKKGAKVVFEEHRQIARARNAGAKAALGRYLFFIDADTTISSNLFNEARKKLESGKIIGGGARVEFSHQPRGLALFLLKFWTMISKTLKLAAGCFIFCHADAFKEVGGFDTRLYASEELNLSAKLKNLGRKKKMRFVILDMPGIISSARKNEQTMVFIATIIVFTLFPAAVRFRRLCFLWYAHQR